MPEKILDLLGDNLIDALVYGAIVLVALVGLFKCIYPVYRNGSLLRRAVDKLERSASSDRPVWREARFLGRSLRPEWQRFLLNAGQMDARGMPCDMEDYINDDTAIDRPGHAQLAELIPSLLTSLGILGTFIGLMEGLTSVNFSDAQGTMDSIPLLLSGMRFAFATSVAGISCSLGFNMLYRMAVGRACRALANFDEAFYELAMPRPLSPEVQLLCQKQDEEERLARLAETAGNRVAASLEMAVGRAMDPFAKSLDAFVKGATQEQVEGVRRIVGQFVNQLNLSLSGQLERLGQTMESVGQSQLQTQKNLQASLNAARATSEEARTMQLTGAETLRQLQLCVDELRQAQARRSESAAMLDEQSRRLAQELAALTQSLSAMRQAADRLTGELDEQPVPVSSPEAPMSGLPL